MSNFNPVKLNCPDCGSTRISFRFSNYFTDPPVFSCACGWKYQVTEAQVTAYQAGRLAGRRGKGFLQKFLQEQIFNVEKEGN